MKKRALFTLVILFTLAVCAPLRARGEGDMAFYFEAAGLTVHAPEGCYVLTRDGAGDLTLPGWVLSQKEELDDVFDDPDLLIELFDPDMTYIIDVGAYASRSRGYDVLTEEERQTFRAGLRRAYEEAGSTVLEVSHLEAGRAEYDCVRYENDGGRFWEYVTAYAGYEYRVSLWSRGEPSEAAASALRYTVEHLGFDYFRDGQDGPAYPVEQAEEQASPGHRYQDGRSGVSFDLPDRWEISESLRDGTLRVKLLPEEPRRTGGLFMYYAFTEDGALTPLYPDPAEREEIGMERLTEADVAGLYGLEPDLVSRVTVNGNEYFLYFLDEGPEGAQVRRVTAQYYRFDRGAQYLFSFTGYTDTQDYWDFMEILNTADIPPRAAPEPPPEPETYPAFPFTDEKNGVSFTVPEGWKRRDGGTGGVLGSFIRGGDGAAAVDYAVADMREEYPGVFTDGELAGIDNSAVTPGELAELLGVDRERVSEAAYNGNSYFRIALPAEPDAGGVAAEVTELIHIRGGAFYIFTFSALPGSGCYPEFEALMDTVEFAGESESAARGPSAVSVLEGVLLTLLLHPLPLLLYRFAIRRRPLRPGAALAVVAAALAAAGAAYAAACVWLGVSPYAAPALALWAVVSYLCLILISN